MASFLQARAGTWSHLITYCVLGVSEAETQPLSRSAHSSPLSSRLHISTAFHVQFPLLGIMQLRQGTEFSQPCYEAGTILNPISHLRKLRLREVKWLAQGHTAGKWQSWDFNAISPALEFMLHYFSSKGWAFKFSQPYWAPPQISTLSLPLLPRFEPNSLAVVWPGNPPPSIWTLYLCWCGRDSPHPGPHPLPLLSHINPTEPRRFSHRCCWYAVISPTCSWTLPFLEPKGRAELLFFLIAMKFT